MANLKTLAVKFRAAELKANRLYDAAFEAADEPGTEKAAAAERAWEKADDAMNALREKIAAEIVKMTGGMIDSKTAWAMTFKPELYALIDRWTA